MRMLPLALTVSIVQFGGSSASATTEPAEADAVADSFAVWAESEGASVSRVACSIDDGADPQTAICYGMAGGPTAVAASAELGPNPAALNWEGLARASPSTDPEALAGTATPTSNTPTTTSAPVVASAPPADAPFPIEPGADGPPVAAIQGRLGVAVDCDYGDQTRRAVEEWQESAGVPVTGTIDETAWELLDIPTTWGDDANSDGSIEPAEVDLVCDGDVELPRPPVDTTGWPDTLLASVAETCSIADEPTFPNDEGPDYRYSPDEDTITIFGAGAEDYPQRGDEVFDTMLCVLGLTGVPDRVISQISSTRALDGMQFADWDGFAAQWNYHPDSGMNMTVWST